MVTLIFIWGFLKSPWNRSPHHGLAILNPWCEDNPILENPCESHIIHFFECTDLTLGRPETCAHGQCSGGRSVLAQWQYYWRVSLGMETIQWGPMTPGLVMRHFSSLEPKSCSLELWENSSHVSLRQGAPLLNAREGLVHLPISGLTPLSGAHLCGSLSSWPWWWCPLLCEKVSGRFWFATQSHFWLE